MLETVICVCGILVFGGIVKGICNGTKYSEEYYRYLRHNKEAPGRNHIDYYRFL